MKGQVLVRILPADSSTDGGLFLPDIAQEAGQGEKKFPSKATVLTLGPMRTGNGGLGILPEFSPGDTVIVTFYSGTKLTHEIGDNLRLLPVTDVLGVLTETDD
jgi:co-chaperonin GroES (HSP10)